jgi:hypothetical protein
MLNILEGGEYVKRKFAEYKTGQKLQVRVNSAGAVEFLHNHQIVYTSKTAPGLPLRAEVSLLEVGAATTATFVADNTGDDAPRTWWFCAPLIAVVLGCVLLRCAWIFARTQLALREIQAQYRLEPAKYDEIAAWLTRCGGERSTQFLARPFVHKMATLHHAVARCGPGLAINPLNDGVNRIGDLISAHRLLGTEPDAATGRVIAAVLRDMARWPVHVDAVHVAASGGGDTAYVAAHTIPAHDVVPSGTKHMSTCVAPAYVSLDHARREWHEGPSEMTATILRELNHLDGSKHGLHRVDSKALSRSHSLRHSVKGAVTVAAAVPPAYQFAPPAAKFAPPAPDAAAAPARGASEPELPRFGEGLISYSPQFLRYVSPAHVDEGQCCHSATPFSASSTGILHE